MILKKHRCILFQMKNKYIFTNITNSGTQALTKYSVIKFYTSANSDANTGLQ